MISFVRYWLPLLIWLGVIFSASADTQSTQHTSRFLEPFLRWLWPDVTPAAIDNVRWFVRKSAHVVEYAILAWLWWRALRRPQRNDPRPWSLGTACVAWLAVVLYAITDEWHQTFVANRSGTVRDVFIDGFGGVLGLGCLWMRHWWRARKSRSRDSHSHS
jgi:VanZ family protein